MNQTTAQAEQSAVGPLAALLGRDILAALVGQVKAMPDHWHRMNEITQKQQIDRMREGVRQIVHHAVRSLVSGANYKAIAIELTGLNFTDGIKGTFTMPKGAEGRHELADSTGKRALVILADAEEYMARMDDIKETADQMELFGGDYDPTDDQPRYRRDEKEDHLSPARTGLMSWHDLKKKLGEGLITKEQAEEQFGGPLPAEPPVERQQTEDEIPDPLDFLDNIVGPQSIKLADLPTLIAKVEGELIALPDPIDLLAGETLRQAFLKRYPGCTFELPEVPDLKFGTLADQEAAKTDARAELGQMLERLYALGYTISLGALQALEPEQMAQVRAWHSDYIAWILDPRDNTPPLPPEWLPKNEPGKNPSDNTKGE